MNSIKIIEKMFNMFYPELTFAIKTDNGAFNVNIKDPCEIRYSVNDFSRICCFNTKTGFFKYYDFENKSVYYFEKFLPYHKISISFCYNHHGLNILNSIQTSNFLINIP